MRQIMMVAILGVLDERALLLGHRRWGGGLWHLRNGHEPWHHWNAHPQRLLHFRLDCGDAFVFVGLRNY